MLHNNWEHLHHTDVLNILELFDFIEGLVADNATITFPDKESESVSPLDEGEIGTKERLLRMKALMERAYTKRGHRRGNARYNLVKS